MLYKLKSVARRGTLFGAAAALAAASFAPLAPPAYADALNPLTDRSLTLSSSAPGWDHFDGSGNTTYAQPNSGANGQKTGNTFDFKVSSDATIQAMSFQYCTTSAGHCTSPGDNATHGTDTPTTSDLKVVFPSADEVDSTDFGTVVDTTSGEVKAVPGFTNPADSADTTGQYAASQLGGNYVVYVKNGATWSQSEGWSMFVSNVEDSLNPADDTGQNNYITLTNATGEALTSGQEVKVVFFGTDTNYIQNPGSGAFFVKINTYDTFTDGTDPDPDTVSADDIVDGGVTVANVMNHSIKIQTKVLETMKFSVGTVDPNTLASDDGDDTPGSEVPSTLEKALYTSANNPANPDTYKGATAHGVCDPIVGGLLATDPVNVLKLGNQSSESSLSAEDTYATHSYWRLSSNSSAGATVYYSGVTLSNTVGDTIDAIGGTAAVSHEGQEQFGLALMNGVDDETPADGYDAADSLVNYSQIATYENGDDNGLTAIDGSTTTDVGGNASWHTPRLYPLVPDANYMYGAGDGTGSGAIDGTDTSVKFAFDETSNSVPVALATEDSQVVDCVTGKMRYIANIAATTPAGIYTTAVNYIAAPQY